MFSYIWQLFDDLNSSAFENLRITDSRALQEKWCAYRTRRGDHHLRGAHLELLTIACLERSPIRLRVAPVLNADGSLMVIEQDADDLRLNKHMQVGILSAL